MVRHFIVFSLAVMLFGCNNDSQHLALGTLERDRIAHTAVTNEVVVELPVLAGSMVTKGMVLVRLNDTIQRAKVAKTTADVAHAQAYLDKLKKGPRDEDIAVAKANVAGAKAQLLESEVSYQRLQNLAKKKLSSQAEFDRARAVRDSEQAHLDSSKEQLLALTSGTREEDLRSAQALLDAALATQTIEQASLQDLTIRASRDGILDNLPWNLGERVTSGSPVAIVLAGKAPFARIYVPEIFRVKIAINDQLLVLVDGIEQPIIGTVRWIANEPAFSPYYALNQQERSRLMYLAEVQLPNSAQHLPSGIPAQVEMP